jgi:hypothetical protein
MQASNLVLIFPAIVLVGGGCAFSLTGMGAPAIKVDRQARNKIRIKDHFDLTNRVPRGY